MKRINLIIWILCTLLSVMVAVHSFRYFGSVEISPLIGSNAYFSPWLYVHAGGAATALLFGAFQFIAALRRRRGVHRWLGRVYAAGCVSGGVAGLILAFGTAAGPIAAWGFGLLAVTWLYTTVRAWIAARATRFDEHRQWMTRSFALTFAAVTLRLYMALLPVMGVSLLAGYRAIAWLAWVPNLVVAEWYLRLQRGAERRTAA